MVSKLTIYPTYLSIANIVHGSIAVCAIDMEGQSESAAVEIIEIVDEEEGEEEATPAALLPSNQNQVQLTMNIFVSSLFTDSSPCTNHADPSDYKKGHMDEALPAVRAARRTCQLRRRLRGHRAANGRERQARG
jgi:hypothetical protein